MNIRDARLCPECEEVHADAVCPRCGDPNGVWLQKTALGALGPGRVRIIDHPGVARTGGNVIQRTPLRMAR